MRAAFDSFPSTSGEAEKAVLGVFVHQPGHYTAIRRDPHDALVAWHLDSREPNAVQQLNPVLFNQLLQPGSDLALLAVGADPESWLPAGA